jgi:hypothetical protein
LAIDDKKLDYEYNYVIIFNENMLTFNNGLLKSKIMDWLIEWNGKKLKE